MVVGEVLLSSQAPTSTCNATFSVTCALVPSQHVRLVTKHEGQWDYACGCVLRCEEAVGADLPGLFTLLAYYLIRSFRSVHAYTLL